LSDEIVRCPFCLTPAYGPYCGRCGRAVPQPAPLDATVTVDSRSSYWSSPPAVPAAAAQASGAHAGGNPTSPPRRGRGGSAIAIGLGAALFVAAAILGTIVATRDKPVYAASRPVNVSTSATGHAAPSRATTTSPAQETVATDTSTTTTTSTATVTVTEPASPGTSEPTSASHTATVDPQEVALEQLQAARDQSVAVVNLDGRWVLQLSSKANGSVDPLQQTRDGSHTFYYADIVDEHEQTTAALHERGIPALTLLGSDFGRQRAGQSRIWVLLGDPGGITTYDEALGFCRSLYPSFSGDLLKDHCLPRQLSRPS